jgi:type IV pilus assembly PilX-like protein
MNMHPRSRVTASEGIALLIVLLAVVLLSALGAALVLATTAETHIAMNFQRSSEALYAAEAAAERAIDDLRGVADWTTLLTGAVFSSFVDGPPSGTRVLDDGAMLDLTQVVNLANCEKPTGCTIADMNAITDDRPWGAENPRWKLFGYGRLRDMLPPGAIASAYYVVAMMADDPGENDNDPLRDGGVNNPGAGIFALRAEAFGPAGAHKVVELTVTQDGPWVRPLSWRELR